MQSQHPSHHQKCIGIGVLFIVGFLSFMVASVQGDDYLKEAPKFLIPCALSDPKNGVCMAKAAEHFFTSWRNGIPGLKNVPRLDPFHVKKVHFEQDNVNLNIKVDLRNVAATGLSQAKVLKASINDEYTIKLLVKAPLLRSKGQYRIKGSILFLQLDSVGIMETEASDVETLVTFKINLVERNDQKFFDVTSIQSSVKNIGSFYVHFDHLFEDNAELEQAANDIFNQNWRDLFEIMRPVLEETLNAFAFERFKKILDYVPASYFFTDLP